MADENTTPHVCEICGASENEYCGVHRGAVSSQNCPGLTMSNAAAVAALARLTEPTRITRENVDRLLDTHQIEVHMMSGAWWSIRRNGATKRWISDAKRITVPFKYGLSLYGRITEGHFTGPDDSLDTRFYRLKPAVDVR